MGRFADRLTCAAQRRTAPRPGAICGAIWGASLVLAGPAHAQMETREGIALQNQILELRQQVQQMQQLQVQANGPQSALPPQAMPENGAPTPQEGGGDMTAQLLVRVGALEDQMRVLHGRIEELANTEQRDHDDLAKQIGDLAFKLGQGGGAAKLDQGGGAANPGQGGGAAASQTPPAGAEAGAPPNAPEAGMDLSIAAPPPAAAHRTAEMALKQGNAALARRDYPAAEAAAREVLALGHGHGPDAQYLLARSLYGAHQYKPAAAAFFQVYKASPKAPRGAEGLLGVANAMIGLGDSRDACEAVAKFSAEFPRADAVLHQAAASIRKRAACR